MSDTDFAEQPIEEAPRPLRMCDSCGGVDDHPRHVVAGSPGDGETVARIGNIALGNAPEGAGEMILAQIVDTATVVKHMDCCRADGCPDGTCNIVTAGAETLRGYDLVDHLTSQNQPTEG